MEQDGPRLNDDAGEGTSPKSSRPTEPPGWLSKARVAMMTVVRGTFMAQKLFAMLLCTSWCKAQRPTVSVCMDEAHREVLSQFQSNAPEYEMLVLKYQNDIADSLGIRRDDVTVRGAHSVFCVKSACPSFLTLVLVRRLCTHSTTGMRPGGPPTAASNDRSAQHPPAPHPAAINATDIYTEHGD